MSDYEVEVIAGDEATVTLSTTSTSDVEVALDTVAVTGTIPDIGTVEITFPGPVMVGFDSVQNVGGANGLLVLNSGDPVPDGTPTGTVILRK